MRPESPRRGPLRWLVRLFPADVRESHGAEIEQVLRSQRRASPRGALGAVRFWASAIADVLRAAPGLHVEALSRDVRYAARTLRRAPGFAAAAVLTIALGTGATSAVFAIVNAVLLRPLPYRDPDRLAFVWAVTPDGTRTWLSPPELDDVASRVSGLEGAAGMMDLRLALTGGGAPEELQVVAASASLFGLLGVSPSLGRFFDSGDDRLHAPNVVVLGHALWARRFGANPAVVGTTLTLDGRSYTVAGVLPPSFAMLPPSSVFPARADAWVPLQAHVPTRARDVRFLHAIARVRPDVPIGSARQETAAAGRAVSRDFSSAYGGREWTFDLAPMRDDLVRGVRPALLILFATVAFVLLIACANVGALLLARGESRRREFAIRAALGASRGRIVRQLLTEGAVLALAGAAGGLLIAAAVPAVTALPALSHVPRLADAGVDWRVLAFALCVSIVAALIFTLVPAAAFSGRSGIPAQEALRAGSRVGRTVRAGRLLAAGEIALATLVLVVALVLTSAFARLLDRDPGIRSDGLMTLRVALPPTYSRSGEITRFFDAAVDRIKALPGVESAGAITQLPFSGAMLGSSFRVDPADGGGVRQADADLRGVTPDYFATLGIGLVEGRLLSARDAAPAPMVAVIDETLARRVSPGSSAIGRRIRWIRQPEVPIEIVGVVRSVRHRGVEQPARETVYRPHAQYARSTMYLAVRTSSDPAALAGPVAAAVQSVDPDQPVSDVMTMSARMRRALAQPGFGAGLGAGLAALALALAGVGVYAVFAFAVAQRRKEMGVRMALGASPSAVLGLVLRDGATVAGAGLLVGLPASTLAIAWVRSMLTGADSGAAPPIAAAGFTMAALALLACWVPARRACRVDPSRALRTD